MNHFDEFTLNEYLDGELDEATAASVAAHLETCTACRAEVATLQALFARLDTVAEIEPDVDVATSVVAALAPQRRLQGWAVVLLVVQTLAAMLLGFWLWPTLQPLLQPLGEATQPLLSPAQWLDWWASLSAWATAVVARIEAAAPPAPTATTGQWGLLLGLALVLWLTGNRLLLPRNNRESGGRHG